MIDGVPLIINSMHAILQEKREKNVKSWDKCFGIIKTLIFIIDKNLKLIFLNKV